MPNAFLQRTNGPLSLPVTFAISRRDPIMDDAQRITEPMKTSLELGAVIRTDVSRLTPLRYNPIV